MVAVALTPINTTALGATLNAAAAVDATNSNKFTNPRGTALIEITNSSGLTVTVTFTTVQTVSVRGTVTYNVEDNAVNISNATSKVFGPFEKGMYNDANDFVTVAFTNGVNVTARVLQPGIA